ncbi:MAG: helicase HerA-like domain-containing protein [Candidatus Hodarchaeota archaeon]
MPSKHEYRFSASDVRNAIKCPRLFVLSKKFRKREAYPIGLGVGNLVHDTLNNFMKIISRRSEISSLFSRDMNAVEIQEICRDLLYELYSKKIDQKLLKIRGIETIEKAWTLLDGSSEKFALIIRKALIRYPIEEISDKIILGSEKSFKLPLTIQDQEFMLTGRIDFLLRDPETDQIIIFDYKTGSPKNINQDCIQLVCYSMGIEREFEEKIEIRVLYFFEDGIRDVELPPSEDLKPKLFTLLLEMVQWLNDYPHRISDEELCDKCLIRQDCYKIFDGVSSPDEIKTGLIDRIKDLVKTPSTFDSSEIKIGKSVKDDQEVKINKNKFTRHLAILGSSGSGKTVLAKVIIEEILGSGISALLIDPQGDLASLAISNTVEGQKLLSNVEKFIFTPGSDKGVNLILDPFADPPEEEGLDKNEFREFKLALLDNISLNLLSILNLDPGKNKEEKSFLEVAINEIWQMGERPSFTKIANCIESIETVTPVDGGERISVDLLLSSRKRRQICSLLLSYAVGTDGTLFRGGKTLNLNNITTGKPKLYVVHLGAIGADVKKRQIVLSWIIRSLYTWMLKNPPKGQDPRLLFYIDEVADFLPPHPHNPASKKMIDLLLRQARKYGVSCMLATQSPASIDYKALDNVLTLLIGRIPTKQSKEKISDLVGPKFKDFSDRKEKLEKLMKVKQGEFLIVSEDIIPQVFKSRMTFTDHRILSLDEISNLYREKKI